MQKGSYFICLNGLIHLRFESELKRLDYIITDNIATFINMNCTLDHYLAAAFDDALKAEEDRITRQWPQTILGFNAEHGRYRYVRWLQRELIRLMGTLLSYTIPDKLYEHSDGLDTERLSQSAFRTLNGLFTFLKRHFGQYLHRDMFIPENYQRVAAVPLLRDAQHVKEVLYKNGINKDLANVILSVFHRLEDPNASFVYRQIEYLEVLTKQITHLEGAAFDDAEQALHNLLFRINFNLPAYDDYVIRIIERDLSRERLPAGRIAKLKQHRRWVSQIEVLPQISFESTAHAAVSVRVLSWIDAEIRYQRTLEKLDGDDARSLAYDSIELSISPAAFAYLLRLMTVIGIVQNKNVSQMARLATAMFHSRGHQQLSPESFRRKFYDADEETRNTVRACLEEMIRYIESDRKNKESPH